MDQIPHNQTKQSRMVFKDVSQNKALKPNEYFGRYLIDSELGRGGMGIVYKAYDTHLKRFVALKVLSQSAKSLGRFMRESSALAQLKHPNIIRLFDFGELPQPYFTMEYVEGVPLSDLIKEKKISAKFLLEIMIKVCDAMGHAHKYNILHRDLKPSNIMISSEQEPIILDFGLAKMTDTKERSLSLKGEVLGTLLYMSPEQFDGKSTTKSDIYSVGATIYEALTFRTVYQGSSYHKILYQTLHGRPIAPRELNPEICPYFEAVCLKCLEKKQTARYKDFRQLTKELQNLKANRPIIAKKYSRWNVARKFIRQNKVVFYGAMLAMAFLFVMFIVTSLWWRDAEGRLHNAQQKFLTTSERQTVIIHKLSLALKHSLQNNNANDDELDVLLSDIDKAIKVGDASQWDFVKEAITVPRKKPVVQNVGMYFAKGLNFLHTGNYLAAIENFTLSIQHNPQHSQSYAQRGTAYHQMKKYDEALHDYAQAIKYDANNVNAYANRAFLYDDLQKDHLAIADYDKAILLKPQSADLYNNRGYFYFTRNQYGLALDDYNKALQLNQQHPIVHANIGNLYYQRQKYSEAIASYKKALIHHQNPQSIYRNLYDCYRQLNDKRNMKFYAQKMRK
ncbi:protein kinase domain-containing protein [Candidatus Uabimicrobium amorphum]|uniref:Serine/threonine protein kinase n=1 Tax=Uabimicrobium amorphum TaxID=2596890 RepID=A0A5S9F6R5_UABAM|nr:protein kinase [Candidatus Uabimicrobium amorphum]BBM86562.1 serine/threonine protein kinase [Candidatus Uabimicrobium amorphum]